MKYWNNGVICKRSQESPGIEWKPGRLKFSRVSPTAETREKISKSNTGKLYHGIPKGSHSNELRLRLSVSAKARAARGILPDNTGRPPWNKGKTNQDDGRISQYASKQRGQIRDGKYPSGQAHWNWKDSDTYSKPFYHYSKEVWRLTKSVYSKNKHLINPNNHPRGRAGISGAHQLDHKVSVHFGFMNNIPPEEIASLDNLQLLTWEENLLKSNRTI